ncbi:DNA-entry nuclease [Companilactobacillus insicii]|uniref:sunset domain-containing protein n=1 Tax=Companilactobacillus insicii TaxID=1732567 RepID=UPI000F7B0510|nr:DNA-entry nuclease [Companilactobacillus insicii]
MQLSKRFKKIVWLSLIVLLSFTALYGTVTMTDIGSNIIQAAKKVKYIGKDKYAIAKKEHDALLAKKKKLVKQETSTHSQIDDIKKQEAEAKKAAAEQQAAAEKQQQEQQKASEAAAKKQVQATSSANSSTNSRGDMNTASSGQIVGNKNSHIYHVPGQRGYNMNSSNAVYFQTEQDAINAGYRKAKV